MGRTTTLLTQSEPRNIRIDGAHDDAFKSRIIEVFSRDWVEEVVIAAELNEEGENPHYHIVGKFKLSCYALNKLIKETFDVSGDGYHNKAPVEKNGGYQGALRYACKGLNKVYAKGLDYEQLHAQYWEINRELRKKKKEEMSIKDQTLAHFKGSIADKTEVVEYIVDLYIKRKARIIDHAVLSLARLVLISYNQTSRQVYINNLCDRL